MKLSTIIFFLAQAVLLSCNQTGNTKVSKSDTSVQAKDAENLSLIQLDDRLTGADSLVFVFYKDPHGKDSLRYTRYYKQYHTTDSGLIKLVKGNLELPTTRFEKIKKCRSEGKIWCFNKGEIFQTIYFSSFSDNCSFLYIIKNGQFYYADITKEMSLTLKDLQVKSLEPKVKPEL